MVKAGEEAGGALEVILQRLAEFKERSQSLKRKVQGAMIYPCAVIFVATAIVTFIMIWIIPKFKAIFEGFEVKLPAITEYLIKASDWVASYWYLLPAVPFSLWLMVKIIKKNKTGAYICDKIALKVPLLGKILEKSIVARTARTLGDAHRFGRSHSRSPADRPRHVGQRGLRARLSAHLHGDS